MDLSAILPLLMRSESNTDATDLLSAMLPQMSQNEKVGEMMQLVKAMNTNQTRPEGLRAIRAIAPDDILGVLVKYYG